MASLSNTTIRVRTAWAMAKARGWAKAKGLTLTREKLCMSKSNVGPLVTPSKRRDESHTQEGCSTRAKIGEVCFFRRG